MAMQITVLLPFIAAALAPWLVRRWPTQAPWLLALVPIAVFVYFATALPQIANGQRLLAPLAWLPGLGINLDFSLDGLSLLFALLISGIGVFIVIYAGDYLRGHRDLPRFYTVLLGFMASMLGLVLADHLLALFVFWELTSITSYLLIGFDHENEKARKAALQGLFVTAGGGLFLLAGFILVGIASGGYSLRELLASGDLLRHSELYPLILTCMLLGAFSKSAQAPLHFWLPNAMAAPTPVSAYLHSATMVKAGIYLLARMSMVLGATPAWWITLGGVGATTMLVGAVFAYVSVDLKRVLAYSTVMALGTLTLLLGLGTPVAWAAFVSYLLAHSLYKGALFMAAGAIDHEAGSKNLVDIGGLRQAMPLTAVATALAALSLAGLPPLFGFVAKELLLAAVLAKPIWAGLLAALLVAASLSVAVAANLAIRPFTGLFKAAKANVHEAPFALCLGPLVLTAITLLLGLWPGWLGTGLLSAAASAIGGSPQHVKLALWHGVNTPLVLSLLTLAVGLGLFVLWPSSRTAAKRLQNLALHIGPERAYFAALDGLAIVAAKQTRFLQNGNIGYYQWAILLTTTLLVGYTLLSQDVLQWQPSFHDLDWFAALVAVIMLAAALATTVTNSQLGAVAAMGVVGFCVALLFIIFSAPDLAITQLLVETLTVVLLVLVLFKLPNFSRLSSRPERLVDGAIAVLGGVLLTLLLLAVSEKKLAPSIAHFYGANSWTVAEGRNVVNVILVDYRAFDTLGEIFVLALAAMGVYAMLHLRGRATNNLGKEQQLD